MNIYAKTENEKIVFLALESELTETEISEYGWIVVGQAGEKDYPAVVSATWLGKPLFDENGIANYKLSDGVAVERTNEEKQAELAERPAPLPSLQEQVDVLSGAVLALMMGGKPNV